MTNCTDCNTPLKHLFGTKWYCPNDCDKKTKAPSSCPRRWWSWANISQMNKNRKYNFLVLESQNDTPPRHACLPLYPIKILGEYTVKTSKLKDYDGDAKEIVPGKDGVVCVKDTDNE